MPDLPSRRRAGGHAATHVVAEDDAWVEGRALVETVEDHELIDPALSSERLLYRLFHERGVRVFKSVPIVRAMLLLARRRRGHAAELLAGRPRSHGRERRDLGDLRVLQRELSVRARRCPARVPGGAAIRRGKARDHELERAPDGRGDCRGGRGARAFDVAGPRAKLPGAAGRCQAAGAGHAPKP